LAVKIFWCGSLALCAHVTIYSCYGALEIAAAISAIAITITNLLLASLIEYGIKLMPN